METFVVATFERFYCLEYLVVDINHIHADSTVSSFELPRDLGDRGVSSGMVVSDTDMRLVPDEYSRYFINVIDDVQIILT